MPSLVGGGVEQTQPSTTGRLVAALLRPWVGLWPLHPDHSPSHRQTATDLSQMARSPWK